MDLIDIELAIEFVSHHSGVISDSYAMICKRTGQIHLSTDDGEFDEIPEKAYESDDWIEIPDRNQLDLGRELVFEFVARELPSEFDRVKQIFTRRGAYARYKDLLDERGMLQE
jgi:hypothetical protein